MSDAISKQDLMELRDTVIKFIDTRFDTERTYYRQLIRQELTDIRITLERLDERSDNDAQDTLLELETVKKRLHSLELKVAKLTTA